MNSGKTSNSKDQLNKNVEGEFSAEDSGSKLLHVSENYRRAKRNLLFWCMLTVLFSSGSDKNSDGIEITAIVRSYSFEPSWIVFFSLVVLMFMLLGYIRADRHLIARNTQFAYVRTIDEAAKRADEIVKQLTEFQQRVKLVDERLREIWDKGQASLSKAISAMDACMSGMKEGSKELREQLNRSTRAAQAQAKIFAKIQSNEDITTEDLRDMKRNNDDMQVFWDVGERPSHIVLDSSMETVSEVFESEKRKLGTLQSNLPLIPSDMLKEPADPTFSTLASELRKLSKDIDRSEKRWLWLFDRGSVFVAFMAAMVAGLWRLRDPVGLSNFQDGLRSLLGF